MGKLGLERKLCTAGFFIFATKQCYCWQVHTECTTPQPAINGLCCTPTAGWVATTEHTLNLKQFTLLQLDQCLQSFRGVEPHRHTHMRLLRARTHSAMVWKETDVVYLSRGVGPWSLLRLSLDGLHVRDVVVSECFALTLMWWRSGKQNSPAMLSHSNQDPGKMKDRRKIPLNHSADIYRTR